jgi:nucleotide-binding universal stress UspA family protein
MHVCESTLPPGRGVLLGGPDPSELLAEARTGLEELVADHRSTGVDVTTHVVAGSATGALIEFCHSDDLLVLGSRGLGGFKALVLGSVATQVTHHAHGPVVVVREGEERLVG